MPPQHYPHRHMAPRRPQSSLDHSHPGACSFGVAGWGRRWWFSGGLWFWGAGEAVPMLASWYFVKEWFGGACRF